MADWRTAVGHVQTLALKVFGARQTYDFEPHDGAAVLLVGAGIFRAAHVELDPGTGPGVSTSSPVFDVRLSDLPLEPRPGVREGKADHVLIHFVAGTGFPYSGDVRFRISDHQPDGEGMTTLVLHQVPPVTP